MKNFLLLCGLLLSLFSASFAHADLTEQQRIADAEQLVNLFHHRYAPMSWKEKLWKIDRNDLANKLMEEAANAKNDIEFYEAMIRYLGALQDAHVSWGIPATAAYGLGLGFESHGKSILLTWIRDSIQTSFPSVATGDVLIEYNGKPVEDEIQHLMTYNSNGRETMDRMSAARQIGWRPQQIVPQAPSEGETVLLKLRSAQTNKEYEINGTWVKRVGFDLADATHPDLQPKTFHKSLQTKKTIPIANQFFPLWNSFVQRKSEPYVTGIFMLGDKRIGYIRLHTWDDETLKKPIDDVVNFLLNEIDFLQDNTDALVLDQNSNPGGAVILVDIAASFFTEKPRQGMLFQLRPTRDWLIKYEKNYAQEKNDWEKRVIKREIDAIRKALDAGQELTDPVSLVGDPQGMLRPMETKDGEIITYTHPVLLLVNGLSCSGGDSFPAIMQDMGVATIFGERTVGCGGSVRDQDSLNYSDLTVRFTHSMMVRAKEQTLSDGSKTRYIENVGVTPDIPYEFSEKDFYDNYESYRQAVEKAVLDLIAKTPTNS